MSKDPVTGDIDDDDANCWLCHCGNYVIDGLHCEMCQAEPPWGCPCDWCQGDRYEDEEYYDEDYFDPYGDPP